MTHPDWRRDSQPPQRWQPGPSAPNQPMPPQQYQQQPMHPQQWQQPPAPYYGPPVVQPIQQVIVNAGGPSVSVTRQRKNTSHGLHLFLTIVTGGMWGLFVWLPISIWHSAGPRRRVRTDHY